LHIDLKDHWYTYNMYRFS